MNRFRKRSDARASEQIPLAISLERPDQQDSSPQLGLPNDFRTSLILPDLSRRFSLLRSSSGDLVSLDHLKSRLAEQRARGAENHISEEEEDMILETLRGIRTKGTTIARGSQESVKEGDDSSFRQSIQSTNTAGSSVPPSALSSSPSGRSAKRYSNNLFGSGRFRDYTYLRNATKNGSIRTQSLTPTESSQNYPGNTSSITDSMRPVTPENNGPMTSAQSNPSEKVFEPPASLATPDSYGEQPLSVAEYRITKTLGPSVLKRASLALEEAIKELEEEAEDEIVMPRRSTPIPRATAERGSHTPDTVRNSSISQSSAFGPGMAISSDKQVHSEPEERRASPVPSRILPGYIPGMPRPMTPRDLDPDDQRSHSTTPRATSPSVTDPATSSVPSSIGLRRDSTSSQSRPSPIPLSSPTSSLFIQRSTNGRQTPDGNNRDTQITEFDSPLNSSLLTRRRPASPLASPPFQPLAVSSRPGTPSNVVWTSNPSANQKSPGHSRNGSWMSNSGASSSDLHGTPERPAFSARSLHSPGLPDSPMTDNGQSSSSSSSSVRNNPNSVSDNRPPSSVSTDFTRSVTPTQNASRSPASPTFSEHGVSSKNGTKRTSKQNPLSSLFNLGLIPPLVFSSMANSSRSSLASDGSSYHTWDGEKDHCLTLISDADVPQPVWHDLSTPSDKSGSVTPGGSPDDDWDVEEIVSRHAGLRKSDFMAIQEKLVSAAIAKSAGQEGRERAPSSLRRRRPSTSQSNYSTNGRDHRVASPPLQTQPPASPISPTSDKNSKANALLRSMVDSIQSTQDRPSTPDTTVASSVSTSNVDMSPNSRRKRDLAQALFGRGEAEEQDLSKSERVNQSAEQPPGPPVANADPSSAHDSPALPSPATPLVLARSPSIQRAPQTPQEEAQLTREVQQKTNAATLALKKPLVNADLSADPYGQNGSPRKRISPNQISTPRLVSASTSVEAVPIPRAPSLSSANNSGPSRIGSRFKKLRGTLRSKNPLPTGDEVTPFPLNRHSPPAVQTAQYDPAKLRVSGGPIAASATETRFKVPVASPPASAGPGLKGFMARLRGKQRVTTDTVSSESEPRHSPLPSLTPASTQIEKLPQQPRLTPKPIQAASSSSTLRATRQPQSAPAPQIPHDSVNSVNPPNPSESTALQQLFDAASNLGLDQGALNDLLARSASTSSRTTQWTMLTRNNSTMTAASPTPIDSSRLTPNNGRQSIDNQNVQAETPDLKTSDRANGRHSADGPSPQDDSVSGVRKPVGHLRRPQEGQSDSRATSAIVRRTIIYPSESRASPIDLNAVTRKNSNRRKRASATSASSRSVHDRAPTPPPPRSPTSKRFSNGPSPPVPNLPTSLTAQADNLLTVPSSSTGGPIEKSNSTYDSLYEMYAGERAASLAANDPNAPDVTPTHGDLLPVSEGGAAVEVIELANGQTIWSIVNGLRDDDESVYTGRGSRASFTSEYSTRENVEGGLQVFVKEHGRSGSKASNSSFLSRKKTLQGQQRPETKVFYSSSEQIGRLIENLSQSMDAGSFNFLPNPAPSTPGHSASSSLSINNTHWTVEERLEHMLGSIRPS